MTEADAVLERICGAFPIAPIPRALPNAPAPLMADAATFARTLDGKAWNTVTLAELRSDLESSIWIRLRTVIICPHT